MDTSAAEHARIVQDLPNYEKETEILHLLREHFPDIDEESSRVAVRRVFVTADESFFMDLLSYAVKTLAFTYLCTITGLDTGERFEFLYHIAHDNGMLITVKLPTERGDGVTIPSVLPLYNGATFYEREVEGLLGVTVVGLPPGRQYPLPDNWPEGQYPMRKDWAPGAPSGEKGAE